MVPVQIIQYKWYIYIYILLYIYIEVDGIINQLLTGEDPSCNENSQHRGFEVWTIHAMPTQGEGELWRSTKLSWTSRVSWTKWFSCVFGRGFEVCFMFHLCIEWLAQRSLIQAECEFKLPTSHARTGQLQRCQEESGAGWVQRTGGWLRGGCKTSRLVILGDAFWGNMITIYNYFPLTIITWLKGDSQLIIQSMGIP